MDPNTLYRDLLDGRLDAAQKAEFAARLRDDEDFAARFEADEDELLFVTRLIWQEQGGHDSCAPRFDPERAVAAARTGLARQRRSRVHVFAFAGAALAAAALVFLVVRPAPGPDELVMARGAGGDVGVAVDWQSNGRPVLSKDTLPAGAQVAAEWTNPDGKFSHLTLIAEDQAGVRHTLRPAQPIGAAGVDDDVDPVGPFALPAGTVKLCGVFSNGTSAEGVRVCTDDLRSQ